MREKDIQNEIRLALNPYAIVFRGNVGKVRMKDGRFFDTGLPRGFSDLFGVRKSDGKAFFIEVKNEKGRTSKYQDNFLKQMEKNGAIVGWLEVERKPLVLLKKEYNKLLIRYNNMEKWIETATKEEKEEQSKNVMDLIKDCNDLLNQIKELDPLVVPGEILNGFKI